MTSPQEPRRPLDDQAAAARAAPDPAGRTLDPDQELSPTAATRVSPPDVSPDAPTAAGEANAPTMVRPNAPVAAAPHDATLASQHPQAVAYQQAIQQAAPGAAPAASFGDYLLLEPIAKGGMGIVYKARQQKLNRIVAIKMILAGRFADRTDVERFYAEAAAAAALSHPNIVAIHEIGEVGGQHFFSMDYIEGRSLAALVRENPLTPQRAAEYVKTIAETMQFAHDRGIVHRDLKPSNILLDLQERPLITDFGLAKQVSNQSQLTMSGAIIGTPSYMPPEQAAGDAALVGPCSDIYSTGAILYELLTGKPPFRAATPFETVRQVIETDPLSPRLVNPNVPKDLETICLKCLQKEPTKRYESSQALAAELHRYLKGEPIQARPISRAERFWRLCQRFPIAAAAISTAIVSLLIGATFSTVGFIQTSRALVAERNSFREQMNAVNDLFTVVSEDTLLNQPGMQPLRKDLLQRALAYYERFLEERAGDPTVQDELASANFRAGLITEAIDSTDKALPFFETAQRLQQARLTAEPHNALRLEALGNTLNALGAAYTKQRQYQEAERDFAAALKIRQQLVALSPHTSECQRLLANTHMNIGNSEHQHGQTDSARKQFLTAQQLRQEALQQDPQNQRLRRDLGKGAYNLGTLEVQVGDLTAAEQNFQAAITEFTQLTREDPENLENQKLLTLSERLLGDVQGVTSASAAKATYAQALARLETLAWENPFVPAYQHDRATVLMNLGYLESEQAQSIAALAAFQQARDLLLPLTQRFKTTPGYQRDLGATLRALGLELQATNEIEKARAALTQSVTVLRGLVALHPQDAEFAAQLEESTNALAALPAATPP